MVVPVPRLPGAERVMGAPTIFGVRHLSPAAAYHLRRALDAAQPLHLIVEVAGAFHQNQLRLSRVQRPAHLVRRRRRQMAYTE